MRYQFYTCDVFTDTKFGGNPLAVFPQAEGLSAETMQQIAREFNFSESTFIFPPEDAAHTRKVRIFTPTTEVPFAGHPNVGTAFVLASIGELGDATEIVFEETAGLVPMTIRREANRPIWCELKAPEAVSIGQALPVDLIAAALSLGVEDIVTTTHPPQVASVGLPFVVVELSSLDALARAQIDMAVFNQIAAMGIAPDIHLYTHLYTQDGDGFDIRARMFAPLDNVVEDPATGSANCALAGMLTMLNSAENGTFNWHIAQGVEMGRPSILDARTEKQAGTVTGVWIAGYSVMVTAGHIEI